jgi:hypothetical protein
LFRLAFATDERWQENRASITASSTLFAMLERLPKTEEKVRIKKEAGERTSLCFPEKMVAAG